MLVFMFTLLMSGAFGALMPEDGSLALKTWFHGPIQAPGFLTHFGPSEYQLLQRDLAQLGVQAQVFPHHNYEYIQDLAFFGQEGQLYLNANFPADEEILVDLTAGISGGFDFGPLHLRKLTSEDAQRLERPYKQMLWTFMEGGEIITGRFADGEAYAIVAQTVRERALLASQSHYFLAQELSEKMTVEQAHQLIAKDLDVRPSNLFFVPTNGHVDLALMALPGGKILLNDPRAVLKKLEELSAKHPELISMYHYYRGEEVRWRDGRVVKISAFSSADIKRVEDILAILRPRFTVNLVAGHFLEKGHRAGQGLIDQSNFINGFVVKAQDESLHIFASNSSSAVLKQHWRETIERLHPGITVKFHAKFIPGAGLDCLGALSPL